jgi:hypothetical protein
LAFDTVSLHRSISLAKGRERGVGFGLKAARGFWTAQANLTGYDYDYGGDQGESNPDSDWAGDT